MDTRTINQYQKEKYDQAEAASVAKLMSLYRPVLDEVCKRESIRILDIGGGAGRFAAKVASYITEHGAHASVFVVDNTRNNTWDELGTSVTFIEESVFSLDSIPMIGTFDIIFLNRVLHHLVFDTWKATMTGYDRIFEVLRKTLKPDGYLCITEETAESYFLDGISPYVIYRLTSCRIKPVVTLCKRLGAKAAGVGVLFQSKQMLETEFSKHGFCIHSIVPGIRRDLKLYMRIGLFLREYFFFQCYVLSKQGQPRLTV